MPDDLVFADSAGHTVIDVEAARCAADRLTAGPAPSTPAPAPVAAPEKAPTPAE